MIQEIIKQNLVPSNDYIFGIAHLSGIIDKKFGDYPCGISIGKRLNDKIIDKIKNGPTLEYLEHYHQINIELFEVAEKIKTDLTKAGIGSIIFKPTIPTNSKEFEKYMKTLRYEVSHKMIATRAGLGWIGKTDLLISKEFGPRLRLVSILIDRQVPNGTIPVEKSKCGNCRICVEKCPAGAANGKLWNVNIDRDEFFDAYKCREKCGELTMKLLNVDKRICGICVSICPKGRKTKNQ